ncbi:hypothetical protein [Verrucosispora sp. WMMD573]|uniref:hypothetical protein n=1 Tax=Verrucosispora sp. WMMD573 TaxID=3015149 RepID=UPI00248AC439|nr:hypothetical protein [Verrucosispora sp. WMMD573]WBB56577.1 hypothetical protein O7601_11185 [Verrucosispora sp. WMMD573]
MTSPAEPPPTDPTPARQVTGPLRELVALVLLGANAVFLFVGLIRLLTPQGAYSTVTGRAASSFFAFIGVEAVVLPVLAVLLATHLAPTVGRAKLITQVALIEYAVSAVLGGLTLLIWVVGRLAEAQLFDAMTGLLTRVAWVALFAAAAYVVWSVWQRLYHVPRSKPEPGLYGTPQQGWPQPAGPGQFGGQPGHPGGGWAPPGQSGGWPGAERSAGYPAVHPGSGHPGWPTAGQAPAAGGPPESPHTWPPHGQPAVPPQSASPSAPSAPPFGQPASADPTQSIPRQGDPAGGMPRQGDPAGHSPRQGVEPSQAIPHQSAEPTQAIPRPGGGDAGPSVPRPGDGEADRTQRIDPGDQPG